jgi:hypothetical protein
MSIMAARQHYSVQARAAAGHLDYHDFQLTDNFTPRYASNQLHAVIYHILPVNLIGCYL